jgi:Skp family chaperone for outer membrane proteins
MKQLIVSLSVATALCSFASSSALAQMKVGIVDMNKVFTSYYKTKDAEARLNDARAQAKTDLDGRLETLKSNMEAINKLEADAKKPELTPDKQQAAIRTRDEKINEVRNLTAKSANSVRPASANCRSSSCACAVTSCRTS